MNFRPKNKYLLVEKVEEAKPESQTSGFILPDEYKTKETYTGVKLLAVPDASPFTQSIGKLLLIPTNMLEEIKVFGEVFYIVPETAVYGVLYK